MIEVVKPLLAICLPVLVVVGLIAIQVSHTIGAILFGIMCSTALLILAANVAEGYAMDVRASRSRSRSSSQDQLASTPHALVQSPSCCSLFAQDLPICDMFNLLKESGCSSPRSAKTLRLIKQKLQGDKALLSMQLVLVGAVEFIIEGMQQAANINDKVSLPTNLTVSIADLAVVCGTSSGSVGRYPGSAQSRGAPDQQREGISHHTAQFPYGSQQVVWACCFPKDIQCW